MMLSPRQRNKYGIYLLQNEHKTHINASELGGSKVGEYVSTEIGSRFGATTWKIDSRRATKSRAEEWSFAFFGSGCAKSPNQAARSCYVRWTVEMKTDFKSFEYSWSVQTTRCPVKLTVDFVPKKFQV